MDKSRNIASYHHKEWACLIFEGDFFGEYLQEFCFIRLAEFEFTSHGKPAGSPIYQRAEGLHQIVSEAERIGSSDMLDRDGWE